MAPKNKSKAKAQAKSKPDLHREPQNRPVMDRLMRLVRMIKKGNYPNMADFMAELEMSESAISRDIAMMYRMKLPLQYHELERGYYFTRPVGCFPGLEVTDEDLQAMVLMRKMTDVVPGASIAKSIKEMFDEVKVTLEDKRRFALETVLKSIYIQPQGADRIDAKSFEMAFWSLWEQRVLQYEYRRRGGQFGVRRVHPWSITEYRGAWYMVAYCETARKKLTFHLGRLRNPQLLERTYTIPESFDVAKHFEKCFGVQGGDGDYKVVVKMDPELAYIYENREWHPSQVREELADGSALLTFHVSSLAEIKYTILGWEGATVIEPPELVQDVIGSLKKTLSNYEKANGAEVSSKIQVPIPIEAPSTNIQMPDSASPSI